MQGELAFIIGKDGRHIAKTDAMSHVAGFACANDASVRDWQWHTQQFTPDEIDDLKAVAVTTRLNGQQVRKPAS